MWWIAVTVCLISIGPAASADLVWHWEDRFSAAEKEKREELMTTRGKLSRYLRLFMPNTIDKVTRRALGLD